MTLDERIKQIQVGLSEGFKTPFVYLGTGDSFQLLDRSFMGIIFSTSKIMRNSNLVSRVLMDYSAEDLQRLGGGYSTFHYFVRLDSDIARLNGHGLVTENKKRIKL